MHLSFLSAVAYAHCPLVPRLLSRSPIGRDLFDLCLFGIISLDGHLEQVRAGHLSRSFRSRSARRRSRSRTRACIRRIGAKVWSLDHLSDISPLAIGVESHHQIQTTGYN